MLSKSYINSAPCRAPRQEKPASQPLSQGQHDAAQRPVTNATSQATPATGGSAPRTQRHSREQTLHRPKFGVLNAGIGLLSIEKGDEEFVWLTVTLNTEVGPKFCQMDLKKNTRKLETSMEVLS